MEGAGIDTSLAACVLVYVEVFSAGTYYVVRQMAKSPEAGIEDDIWPTRTAGLAPGPAWDLEHPHRRE
jgi:cytochrome d ubiquinol oxidase subunit I